jgi:hypothetical protein
MKSSSQFASPAQTFARKSPWRDPTLPYGSMASVGFKCVRRGRPELAIVLPKPSIEMNRKYHSPAGRSAHKL